MFAKPVDCGQTVEPDTRDVYIAQLNSEYEALRASMNKKKEILVPLAEARTNRPEIDWASYSPVVPARSGVQVIPYIPLEEIIPYIHWTFFFSAWKLNGRFRKLRGSTIAMLVVPPGWPNSRRQTGRRRRRLCSCTRMLLSCWTAWLR